MESESQQCRQRSVQHPGGIVIQRLLHSKNLIACLLAAATGFLLYIRMPFPEENFFLELIFLWARPVFLSFKYA